MPWIDYEQLSGPKKALVWLAIVAAGLVIASILWFVGFRPDDVPTIGQ